ncbi:MAG: hypothetical protein K9J79_04540 [Desulfobacteraceae bacterium]|nr:hypothetical protein [Desulfobacteraceae bacterium]
MAEAHSNIKSIIDFFLNLFVIQTLGRGKEPDSATASLVSEDSAKTAVYEFTVRGGGVKKHRRISVQPIGEKVGSKSACYKVIYDTPLVVKIPPYSITDFSEYLKHIRREHRIVNRLSPEISCVFPKLEAILKMVPFLKLSDSYRPEEIEDVYINQMTRRPGLQQYLKIGGSFVFFMSLTPHMFFNQMVESIHNLKGRVKNDIVKNLPEAFDNPDAFERLYGEDNYPVYLELRNIFLKYEDSVRHLAEKYGNELSIPEYRWHEWFFSFLAGFVPDISGYELPEQFGREVHSRASQVISDHKQSVEKIYRIVHNRVRQKNFDTNQARIKGIIINVLELLYQLRERNLALRDLKPDNMYIDRHLDAADHILADPELYGFGLIDLETAVCFDPDGTPGQPLLAGTPAYATPSHLFSNKLLEALYPEELGRIFRMQDWYAAVGIMFNVITGKLLFAKTARLMPEILRAKRQGSKNQADHKEIYKNISGRFWQAATEEFKENIESYGSRITALEMDLPFHLKDFLKTEAEKEQRMILDSIALWLEKSPALSRYQDRILAASHENIVKAIKKHRSEIPQSARSSDAALRVLDRIAICKYRREHLDHAAKRLSEPIHAHFLLSFIFDRAFYSMYRQEWSRKQPCPTGPCLETYGKS